MSDFIYNDLKEVDFSEYQLIAEKYLPRLFPINRSILNEGVIKSLKILQEVVDFDIINIPTGLECYDWIVPEQWSISEAFIEVDGKKVIDFSNNNLHVLNFSEPIDRVISYSELVEHLFFLEHLPDAIPYRTSYYKKNWGFCISFNQFKKLEKDKTYKVKINSTYHNGNISIAERVIKGQVKEEIIISAYTCHPSMANDSLSGVIMWTMLLKALEQQNLKYSYRFVLVPETIGAIAYLKLREKEIKQNVKRGYVLTTCGGPGQFGYKYSFKQNDIIDECTEFAFRDAGISFIKYPFDVSGSDERQYSSPYFRIPCGTISKDKYYEYDEYHTSLDNLSFVKPAFLFESFLLYLAGIQNIELASLKFISLNPACEPFLTKRELYSTIGITINNKLSGSLHHSKKTYDTVSAKKITGNEIDLILWLMFWSDGEKNLMEIAKLSNKPLHVLYKIACLLVDLKLLKQIE